ncbi:unnamed protein product [Closterium sp. NIES-65]|nr:unnamed protein product [Closterium sp. NIES-65]
MSSRLNRQQKEAVQQFVAITGTSDRGALAALRASEWNMELAFDLFYSSSTSGQQLRALGRSAAPKVDPRQLEHLFLRYKDPHCDLILVDGVSKLCEDLEVDPQDIVMLILSWHFKAATMCEYSKEEFMQGMQRLGVSSAGELKARLPALRSEINDDHKFREIYNFSFDWAKEKGQKSLAFGTAIGMWQLLFTARPWRFVEHWCEYLQMKHNKAISRDTWQQLLEFTKITDPSLSSYDEEGAWPYLVDEFVSHLREEGVVPSKPDAA